LTANRERATRFSQILQPLTELPGVRNFRHIGMIWAFEVDSARSDFSQAFFAAMLARGCLVRPIGNTVYFMPPYCIADSEIELLAEACADSLAYVAKQGKSGAQQPALP